ncbi:unnamed protein product, partial [Durusdinium trenchii]
VKALDPPLNQTPSTETRETLITLIRSRKPMRGNAQQPCHYEGGRSAQVRMHLHKGE